MQMASKVLMNGHITNGHHHHHHHRRHEIVSDDSDSDESTPTLDQESRSASEKFDYVRFTVADIHGIARSKSVPSRHFRGVFREGTTMNAGVLANGPRAEVSTIEDFRKINFANCVVRSMPDTIHALPWATNGKYRVGEVLCETFWMKPLRDGAPQDGCPRYVARKQLQRLNKMGYNLYSSFEAEFMVFKRGTLIPVFDGNDICSNLRLSEVEDYLYDLDKQLSQIGIHSVTLQTERGSGQLEFALEPSFGIEAVDKMFIFKQAVKEMSLKRDWQATFMTQPFPESSNNGLHFNHSIWSINPKNKNVFHDAADVRGLSDVAKHWVAGLVKHSKALATLCCPTVNCYRRLCNPWAPDKANWGLDDRLSSFRVKSYDSKSTYVENRIPSGAANPYLVLAATVAAGMDGLLSRLECPPERLEYKEAADLPRSLGEALKDLEEDRVITEALGEEFVRWFVKVKKDLEVGVIKNIDIKGGHRQMKERDLYFEHL